MVRFLPALLACCVGDVPPEIRVPVRPVRIADDDGSRAAAIEPAQFAEWVSYANEAYEPVGVRFDYDPADGIVERRSTLLNEVTGAKGRNWREAKAAAQELKESYPDELVVLFRHGPADRPTGRGFAAVDYDFVVMPGFVHTTVCGRQNVSLLAHEFGHHFGLVHTFAADLPTIPDAMKYLAKHGRDPECFDGDGLADTPPDPFIKALQCKSPRKFSLMGREFEPDRDNLMGYWRRERPHLSAGQVRIARWFVKRRHANGMRLPKNVPAGDPVEAETLTVRPVGGAKAVAQPTGNFGIDDWSGGQHLFVRGPFGGAVDGFPLQAPGRSARYQLEVYLTMAPNYGVVQIWLDGRKVGEPIDCYAPRVIPSGRIDVEVGALRRGRHEAAFEIVGRNEQSTDSFCGIDCYRLVRE